MEKEITSNTRRRVIKFSLGASIYLLGGCSLDSSKNRDKRDPSKVDREKNDTYELSSHSVWVERSAPLTNSVVIDSLGKIAVEMENGIYKFKNRPTHPIYVFAGSVNIKRNGTISVEDIHNTLMLSASMYRVATIVTTLAAHEDKRSWLKESFNLTDDEIDKDTPSQNRKIAAISDEIFNYCTKNSITKPSKISLDELDQIQDSILKRVELYIESDKPVEVLEKELALSLNHPLVTKDDVEFYKNGSVNPKIVINNLPKYDLTEEQKYSLAFMWNEERLAGDAYSAFYASLYESLTDKEKILADKILKTIAHSERLHERAVEALIEKYNIDIIHLDEYDKEYDEDELKAMKPGEYPIKKLQEVWDNVAPVGTKDLISAFKIGCIVEVGDVEDLDRYIKTAGNAIDLRYVFELLRNGSILHYWAFDRGLKELGVKDGACFISSRYCKAEGEFEINGDGGTDLALLNWVEKE